MTGKSDSAASFRLRTTIDRPRLGPEDWREELELRVPTTQPAVAELRAHRPSEEEYATALGRLLVPTGLYTEGLTEARSDTPVVMTIAKGIATIRLNETGRWAVNEDEPGPCFSLFLDKTQMSGTAELVLRNLKLESTRPLPDLDDGQGRLVWQLPREGVDELSACVSSRGLKPGWREAVRNQVGWWGLIGPIAAFFPTLLLFVFAAYVFGQTRPEPQPSATVMSVGRVVTRSSFAITGLLVILLWTQVISYVLLGRNVGRTADAAYEAGRAAAVALPTLAVAILFALSGRVVGARARVSVLAFAIAGIALLSAPVIAEASAFEPFVLDQVPPAIQAVVAAATATIVLALPLFALAAATRLALVPWREQLGATRGSRRGTLSAVAVLLAGIGLALHAIVAGYVWPNRVGDDDLGVTRAMLQGLSYQPFSLLAALLSLFQLVLFFVLLASLREVGKDGGLFPAAHRTWLAVVFGLLFAGYVVGLGGRVESVAISVPLSFALALLAIVAIVLRGHRSPESSDTPTDEAPPIAAPSANWWENGVRSTRAGIVLALLPFGFYVYVLLDTRLGDSFALRPGFGPLHLSLDLIGEAVFWLTAAATLGWLYAYLPGPYGVLKGAALAAIYFGSLGVTSLVLTIPPDWLFRSFALTLFLVILGMRLDLQTLSHRGETWTDLHRVYRLGTVRGIAGYVSPALIALIGIAQQVYTGEADDAFRQFVQTLPDLIPGGGPSGQTDGS